MSYNSFTNLYSLSKTLRFELKPIWSTQKLLDESQWNLFRDDFIRQKIYEQILKPKIEEIDAMFIQQALENPEIGFDEDLVQLYKTDRKEFIKRLKDLAKKLWKSFAKFKFRWLEWPKNLLDVWKSVDVVKLLYWNETYKDDEFEELNWKTIKQILDQYFSGFTTYLTTFNENRKNFYKDDLKFGSAITRALKDNLPKFIENIFVYEKIKDKIDLTQEEKEIFDIKNYKNFLNQDWIDRYNKIIWKINSKINQYNQNHNLKWSSKLPFMQILYKQILGDPQKENILSFVKDIIDSDEKLIGDLKNFIEQEKELYQSTMQNIIRWLEQWEFDLSWIGIKKWNLKILSNRYLQNWSVLENLLPKFDDEWKAKDIHQLVTLEQIKQALNPADEDIFKESLKDKLVWNDNFERFLNLYLQDLKKLAARKEELANELQKVLNWNFNKSNSEHKQLIKDYLDTVIEIEKLLRIFSIWKGKEQEELELPNKDIQFYNYLQEYLDLEIHKFYNAVRNYLTKKHYLVDKIRLYFDNSTLLDGWDKNKEKDNWWIILRKWNQQRQDWDYFLAIMKKGFHHLFDVARNPSLFQVNENEEFFEKMEYKLLPWPNKMLPKVFFSKKNIWFFVPSKEILQIREKESFKQGDNFNLEDLHKWIDFMKQSLQKHLERRDYNFKFKPTEEYQNINEFYSDVEKQWYKLHFVKVNAEKLMDLVNQWRLYLFQIWNKDFSPYTHWKPNLHTIYWKALFEKENFKWEFAPVYKLNWKAEVFFRPKAIEEVKTRKLKDGTEIVKKRRYTQHKLLFHVPITLNFVNKGINPKSKEVNEMIKDYIKQNEMKIIWIDRWENHLLYVVMIDENGKILEKKSLNCIINQLPNGQTKEICYIDKLVKKEKARDDERKSWDDIETIKELKEWYISQVISYLINLATQNNAIIVLEDLNSGFKRSRQKIERQIYQKFETALATKLNYIVFKDRDWKQVGGYYKALQLAPAVQNYQDIYSQTWILFFTQPAYTSTTCPVCGFRKNWNFRFENISKALDLIWKMEIRYQDWYFIFEYDLKDIPGARLTDKKWNKLENTKVKIFTKDQERIFRNKDNKKLEKKVYDMTEYFKELFKKYWIDLADIKGSINSSLPQQFFKDFLFGLNLLLKIRNSDHEKEKDYIQCPSCGFDSRKDKFQRYERDWDANGAYNIALRWKIIIDKIRKGEKNLGVSLVEWDRFREK